MKKTYETPTYEVVLETDICVACGAYAGENGHICINCEVKTSGKF